MRYVLWMFMVGVLATTSLGLNRSYRFMEIEYPGSFTTIGGINDSRDIVGYYQYDLKGPVHAFLYSDGIYQNIDAPGEYSTAAISINNAGKIIGVLKSCVECQSRMFVREWGEDGWEFRALDAWPQIRPAVITNKNQVAGDYWEDGRMGHFSMLLRTGVYSILAGPSSNLYSMNGGGTIVYDGSMVTKSATTILALPGAYSTHGYSISDKGFVAGVGMVMVGNQQKQHGFIYKSSYETVDYPGAWHTGLVGINNNGDVVGYASGIVENGVTNWYNEAFVRLVQ